MKLLQILCVIQMSDMIVKVKIWG